MIYDMLFEWQKEIINNYSNKDYFGLFLDMGLGKTPISLAFAERHKADKILVISIDSKVKEEADIEGSFLWRASKSDIKYNLYTKKNSFIKEGPKKYWTDISNETKDIYLINYESLYKRKEKNLKLNDNLVEFINSCKNKRCCVILDESHYIKSSKSLQYKSVNEIKTKLLIKCQSLNIYLLSGTPFTVGYEDFYTQLNILGYDKTKTYFIDRYCIKGDKPGLLGWQQPIVGYKNVNELFDLVHTYSITMKTEDKIKLPDKIFNYIKLDLTNEFSLFSKEKLKGDKIYEELKKRAYSLNMSDYERDKEYNNPFYRNIAYPELKRVADTPSNLWMRARQLSIGFQGNSEDYEWYNKRRVDKLKEILKEHIDNYVIFYNYTPELLEIYNICEELGYNIDVCFGGYKSEYFYEKYHNLSESEKLTNKRNVIIANYASGSAAKNWQEYNKCILFSLPTFGDFSQGIKRVHRIGQKETVVYYIFYQKNWLDESMLRSLRERKEYDEKMFMEDLNKNG